MRLVAAAIALTVAAAIAAPAPASAASPSVRQMVVFRDGTTTLSKLRAKPTTVRVGRRRCALGRGTVLAALVRSRPPRLSLRDYGRCSRRRARDSGQLFVRGIGPDRNRGAGGWVYKVGNRIATTGAGDPTGPFGRGRLRSGARITWFYCVQAGACQRTLSASAQAAGGVVIVRVRAHDDEGGRLPAAGALVQVGPAAAVADERGEARLAVPAGRHIVSARLDGAVPAFPQRLSVP